jgi:hypothetical protein
VAGDAGQEALRAGRLTAGKRQPPIDSGLFHIPALNIPALTLAVTMTSSRSQAN